MRPMAANPDAAPRRQGGKMKEERKTEAATIMVVDDDQRNGRLMESILRSNGFQVTKAYDGAEAKRSIEAKPPDLVLLDVMMPKMSGFELCRLLRDRYETRLLPIIMITALNSLEAASPDVQPVNTAVGTSEIYARAIDVNVSRVGRSTAERPKAGLVSRITGKNSAVLRSKK